MRHSGISSVEQIMGQARRRELLHRGLRHAGWGLAAGVMLGLLLAGVDRLTAATIPPWVYPSLAVLGVVAGLIVAAFTLPARLHTAVTIDRALRLKDRIGTIESLDERTPGRPTTHDPEFIELLRQDAQQLAQRVDVREATPVHFTGIWAMAVFAVIALLATLQFMPEIDWSKRPARRVHTVQQIEQAQIQAQDIARTLEETLADVPKDDPALDDQAREELAALERLAEQLAQRQASPDEVNHARDESAARLNELADRLADQAQRDMAANQELARRFAGMDSVDRPEPPMSAAEFDEALRRGDFGAAARELEGLLREARDLPQSERAAAADHLRDLAEELQQPEHEMDDEGEQAQDQLTDALRDMGIDEETIERLRENPPSAEEIERALRQMGVDEDIARQLSEDFQEHQEQQQQREQADRDVEDVAEALNEAAQDVEQPPPASQPSPPSTQPQRSQPPSTQPAPAEQPRSQPQQQPSASQPQPNQDAANQGRSQDRPGEAQSDQPQQQQPQGEQQSEGEGQSSQQQQPQPGEQQQQQPGTGEQQQPGSQPAREPATGDQPGTQPQQQPQPSQQPGTKPAREPAAGDQPQPQPSSTPQRVPEQGQPTPAAQEQEGAQQAEGANEQPRNGEQPQDPRQGESQPGTEDPANRNQQRQAQARGERTPNDQQQPERIAEGGNKQPPPSAEAIRRMAERMRQAQDRQRSSEQMREAARRIAENMSPQERERWAGMWRRQLGQPPSGIAGGPGDQPGDEPQLGEGDPSRNPSLAGDDLDLRGEEVGDQVIAQWLSNDPLQGEPGSAPTAAPSQRVRQAQSVAERAVNESTVHRRYHKAIKRYFGRLDRTLDEAKPEE